MAFPTSEATRHSLLRTAVAWCLWLGNPDCFRNQKAVLWDYADKTLRDMAGRAYLEDDVEYLPYGGTRRAKRVRADNYGTTPMNHLVCGPQGYDGHPACYPVALARFWVRYLSSPGGTILDPFCGSGSTGVAAISESRNFVGIELKREYAQRSRARLRSIADAAR